jgi:membrane protease YdiL (CAAX protease family)
MLKAAFKNSPAIVQLLMLLAVAGISLIAFSLIGVILILIISPERILDIQQNLGSYPDLLRVIQLSQILGLFIFPPLICAWLFSDDYKEYLHIRTSNRLSIFVYAFIGVIVFVPFINFTSHLNQQMVLPEALTGLETWMKSTENEANQLIEAMLSTHNPWTILFNILIVCVLTGIGEELMFRGLLQAWFSRFLKNPHLLVWTVAILFSAFHLQFYGFVPRMLLGAFFGYLMVYSRSILVPALAHFTHNFVSLAGFYLFQDAPEKMEEMDALGTGSTLWLALASLALFAFCFWRVKLQSRLMRR